MSGSGTKTATQAAHTFYVDAPIFKIAISRQHNLLACVTTKGTLYIFNHTTFETIQTKKIGSGVRSIAWLNNTTALLCIDEQGAYHSTISPAFRTRRFFPPGLSSSCVDVHPFTDYAIFGSMDGHVYCGEFVENTFRSNGCKYFVGGHIHRIKFNKDGTKFAALNNGHEVIIWDIESNESRMHKLSHDNITSIAWDNFNGIILGTNSGLVHHIHQDSTSESSIFEGLVARVTSIAVSNDGETIAAKSVDNSTCIWDIKTLAQIISYEDICISYDSESICFVSNNDSITMQSENAITIQNIDHGDISSTVGDDEIIYSSAKIVFVGETSIGKSHLIYRMLNDKIPPHEEHTTTHGMRVHQINPNVLDHDYTEDPIHRRDIFLWDLGGQGEYRLVHQLFLHDASVAVIVIEPTRTSRAIEEIDEWCKRLREKDNGTNIEIIVVGSKMDRDRGLNSRSAILAHLKKHNISEYIETSSITGRGIDELKNKLAHIIPWSTITNSSRPKIFQAVRDCIKKMIDEQIACISFNDLYAKLAEDGMKIPENKLIGVIKQLSLQGTIALQITEDSIGHIILNVSKIEQYAGSIIILAQESSTGVPTITERSLLTDITDLPGMKKDERLSSEEESIVIGTVIEMLVNAGICTRHEGWLIFPSLYTPTTFLPTTHRANTHVCYDFSGAVENIWTCLVSWLVVAKEFGRHRLWKNRAEFEDTEIGMFGIEKTDISGGYARIDIYFDNIKDEHAKHKFILFIEQFLKRSGINISEQFDLKCTCGEIFSYKAISSRMRSGDKDIGCSLCDTRTQLPKGAFAIRLTSEKIENETWELNFSTQRKTAAEALVARNEVTIGAKIQKKTNLLKILHLSDLHFDMQTDPRQRLQPLLTDLSNPTRGLGVDRLDYIVISGDLTNKAAPEEFKLAYEFVSMLLSHYNLNPDKCLIAPGNHDVNWNVDVYNWKHKNQVDNTIIDDSAKVVQADLIGIRNDARYHERIINFDKHFYHYLFQKPYPLQPEKEYQLIINRKDNIHFMIFNSAQNTDIWHPHRSGIDNRALSSCIYESIKQAMDESARSGAGSPLRIAIWHHPISGPDQIKNTSFIDNLIDNDVKLILHGHSHELQINATKHTDPRCVTIGSGAFSARATARPESTPMLYNLISADRVNGEIEVNSRMMKTNGGSWEAHTVFMTDDPNQKTSIFKFNINTF